MTKRQKTLRFAGWDFAALQQSRLYDVLMRLPMLMWSTFLALVTIVGLQQYVRQSGRELPDVVYILNIVMRLSVIAYLVVIAATLLVRVRPAAKARGVEPRISALIGTFLLTVNVLFPRRELSPGADMVSTLLTLGGTIFAVVVLTQLRASLQHYGRGAADRHRGGVQRRPPSALSSRGDCGNRCRDAVFFSLDGRDPSGANRLSAPANAE